MLKVCAKRDNKELHLTKNKEYNVKNKYIKSDGTMQIYILNDRFYNWIDFNKEDFSEVQR